MRAALVKSALAVVVVGAASVAGLAHAQQRPANLPYPPGRVGAPHRHPGFVLAYVLEGAVVAKISGQGDEKTYTAGQMFYEQPGAVHEVSKNASQTQPARLLAFLFAKKGSGPVTQKSSRGTS